MSVSELLVPNNYDVNARNVTATTVTATTVTATTVTATTITSTSSNGKLNYDLTGTTPAGATALIGTIVLPSTAGNYFVEVAASGTGAALSTAYKMYYSVASAASVLTLTAGAVITAYGTAVTNAPVFTVTGLADNTLSLFSSDAAIAINWRAVASVVQAV